MIFLKVMEVKLQIAREWGLRKLFYTSLDHIVSAVVTLPVWLEHPYA